MPKYRLQNIKNNLAATMGLFVTLTVLALGWVHYYSVSRSIMKDTSKTQLITSLKAHQSNLLIILEKAIETSTTLADDPALIHWFSNDSNNVQIKEIALDKINFLYEKLGYPTLFAVNNNTYEYWCENHTLLDIVSEDDPDDSWYFETIADTRKSTLNFDYNNVLKQSMLFVNVLMGSTDNPVGVAGVGIDPSLLIQQFRENKPSEASRLWLIDNHGKVLLSEDKAEINLSINQLILSDAIFEQVLKAPKETVINGITFKDEKYELACMPVGTTDYKVIMIVPDGDLLAILDVIGYNTIWLTIIVLLSTLVVASLLAKTISKPIIQLTKLSDQIAHSELNTKVDAELIKRKDEIGQLARGFDSMQKQLSLTIEHLNEANVNLENEKKQLKTINIELKETFEKATESERLTKAFMANISHEIRTPMNSILGFAQLLEVELNTDETLRTFATTIVKNGNQLLAILNNIIEVAKMDSGIIKPSLSIFSAQNMIKEVIGSFSYSLKPNIKLINQAKNIPDDIQLESDKLLTQRILNNLISNAIKYTEDGDIKVGFELNDAAIIFYVTDTGVGISEKDTLSIFKPFWQVDSSKSINEGAGLGLAISKKVVEILNGKIWVESIEKKGSTFYFSLPLQKA